MTRCAKHAAEVAGPRANLVLRIDSRLRRGAALQDPANLNSLPRSTADQPWPCWKIAQIGSNLRAEGLSDGATAQWAKGAEDHLQPPARQGDVGRQIRRRLVRKLHGQHTLSIGHYHRKARAQ